MKVFGLNQVRGKWSMNGILMLASMILTAPFAHSQAAAEEKKDSAKVYGVVDMQKIILSVEEGKTARKQLETEIQAKEKELGKQKQELDEMNKAWQQQAAVLSEEARMNKQKEFQEKFLALRQAEMDFQNQIKQKEQKATQQIAIKVAGIVEKIARDKNLEAVYETNTSGLLYLKNPLDLTPDIIASYNSAPSPAAPTDGKKAAKK